jgi:hypothetical protein
MILAAVKLLAYEDLLVGTDTNPPLCVHFLKELINIATHPT